MVNLLSKNQEQEELVMARPIFSHNPLLSYTSIWYKLRPLSLKQDISFDVQKTEDNR